MNCYLCFVELGSGCHPALAICQRCGAAICESHLVRLSGPSVPGLAGTPKCLLMCSSCFEYPSPRQLPRIKKDARRRSMMEKIFGSKRLLFWRHRSPALPAPDEAVKAVEEFLNRQRRS